LDSVVAAGAEYNHKHQDEYPDVAIVEQVAKAVH
jgi:hypothetical protein